MKKRILFLAALSLAGWASVAAMVMGRDDAIIRLGLKQYDLCRNAGILAASICTIWAAAASFMAWRRERPEPAPAPVPVPDDDGGAHGRQPSEEESRQETYRKLQAFAQSKWQDISEIEELLSQLDSVNEYQAKMGPILAQNGYLSDKPAEIVQRLEDCMYTNIRKLLNYMDVLQTKSLHAMQGKSRECVQKNQALLDKTDEFILAIVDYVNGDMSPGEESRAKEYVDNYMYLVLDAIKLPETYLK